MYVYTEKYICEWGDELHSQFVRMKISKLNSLWQKTSSFREKKKVTTVNTRLSAFPRKLWRRRVTITTQMRENCQPSSYIDKCFNLKILLGSFQKTNTSLYQCSPSFIMSSFINTFSEAMRYQSSSEQSPVTLLSYCITVKFRGSQTLEDLSPQIKKWCTYLLLNYRKDVVSASSNSKEILEAELLQLMRQSQTKHPNLRGQNWKWAHNLQSF